MRAYILEIQCFDENIFQIDWNYQDFCEIVLTGKLKFLQIKTIDGEELILNLSTIKIIKKKNIIRKFERSNGEIETKIIINWVLKDLSEKELSLLES